jgi:hypothetical protein
VESLDSDPKQEKPLGIIFNPIASSGLAEKLSQDLIAVCEATGREFRIHTSKPSYASEEINEFMLSVSQLAIIGGDGTVRSLALAASAAKVPIVLLPAGNESLLAKRLGHTRSVKKTFDLLNYGKCKAWHFGLVNHTTPFLLMLSIGFDSCIVKALGHRNGRLSNSHYILAAAKSFFKSNPKLSITISDSVTVIPLRTELETFCIVANDRSYPKLTPIPQANGWEVGMYLGTRPGSAIIHRIKWLQYLLEDTLRISSKSPLLQNGDIHHIAPTSQLKICVHDPTYPVQVDGDLLATEDGQLLTVSQAPQPLLFLGHA